MSSPIIKTPAMQVAEHELGESLETWLVEQYRTHTQAQIAEALSARGIQVSQATVGDWLARLGIQVRFRGQRPPEAAAL